jgi:hypothetical protein
MKTTKRNINTKMDWNALDRSWAEQYEEDYGNLFTNTTLNNHRICISASNIEAGLLASA